VTVTIITMVILSKRDCCELFAIGAHAALALLLYRYYKKMFKDAECVEKAETYAAGTKELLSAVQEAKTKSLPYVCVEGIVEATGQPLSQHTDEKGVVLRQQIIEHRLERIQGVWRETNRVIKDVMTAIPLRIAGQPSRDGADDYSSSYPGIEVTDVSNAEYLAENLNVVHHKVYSAAENGILSRAFAYLFGEQTKGYAKSESMLKAGMPIIGIGHIAMARNGILRLGRPPSGQKFIVTALSKDEVIRLMREDAEEFKLEVFLFYVFQAGIVTFFLYALSRRLRRNMEFRRRLAEVRRRHPGNAAAEVSAEWMCIVCRAGRREVIALDCGHIALCARCSQELREPLLCPVCRARVVRFLPVYIP